MTNMQILATKLMDARIPFEVTMNYIDGPQIWVPSSRINDPVLPFMGDVVCHDCSMGGPQGLLELMGFGLDDVEGYCTAEDAFTLIRGYWNETFGWQ